MKMINFKPYIGYAIQIIIILVLGSLLMQHNCRSPYETKRYLELKGQFEGYKAQVAEEQEIKDGAYKDIQKKVDALQVDNDRLQGEKEAALGRQTQIEADLVAAGDELRELRQQGQTLTAAQDIINNLRAQNRVLDNRFNLAMADLGEEKTARAAAESQILNLRSELDHKDTVIISLQDSIRKRDKLLELCEDMNKEGEKGSWWRKLESLTVYGFAAYGVLEAGKEVFK